MTDPYSCGHSQADDSQGGDEDRPIDPDQDTSVIGIAIWWGRTETILVFVGHRSDDCVGEIVLRLIVPSVAACRLTEIRASVE